MSAACTGANVHSTLLQALAAAALNGQSSDEIRLSNTVSYTGNTHGNYTLTDWNATGAGTLTIVGGYPDCFTPPSGRTVVGNSGNSSFTVNTSNHANSIVTLRNLELSGNASRGLVVRAGGIVTLDNVDVRANTFSGVDIDGGGIVEILANSFVRQNSSFSNPFGGGVRCTGANSSAIIHGMLQANRAQKGGNLFVSTGCYTELKDGMRIVGTGLAGGEANAGGGAYVDNGGSLFADGRSNRVIFDDTLALEGGALYVNGTGFVLFQNTHINKSTANLGGGAAIYARDGGTTDPQLIMDQTTHCNLLFRCSEIQDARHVHSVVLADNSFIVLHRTVIELSKFHSPPEQFSGLVQTIKGGKIRLNRIGLLRNEGQAVLASDQGIIEASHVTLSANINADAQGSKSVYLQSGSINLQNSVVRDSSGADLRGVGNSFVGDCNLVDNGAQWPPATFHVGTAQFINAPAGDARQTAGSPGVDMCMQDSFAWSSETDIANQSAPVNEMTNPQGLPGDTGGLYDAGFDEVYANIGNDEFLLSITKEGSGTGVVISNPAGISCGVDCSETYFNGTVVTLFAAPTNGSVFAAWHNCPLVNQNDECLTQVNSNHSIRAEFQSNEVFFNDGFE